MLVIPAIDLSEGKVVRLTRGEMSQKTVYSDRPVDVARQWEDQGARWIHIVDLDAAITCCQRRNLDAIADIVNGVTIGVQVAGGLRTVEDIAEVFATGAMRAVVGTVAIEDRAGILKMVRTFPDRIVVAVDARDGRVAVRGWTKTTDVAATDLALQMEAIGARRLMCTDIATDGTLSGPSLPTIRSVCEVVNIPVIAAGGVASLEDITALRQLEPAGLEGAIIGRALYTGALTLSAAIEEAEGAR